MKRILSILTVALFFFTSCSEDWVTRLPSDTVGEEMALENTNNGKAAINGIAKLMVKQYWDSQGFNGEGTIKLWYGNYNGNNFVRNQSGWKTTLTFGWPTNNTSSYTTYPWYYYYRMIANANRILDAYDTMEGPESDKKTIKAQALTYRAYSYFMLSQIYCKRWVDSNNGAADGVVLRLSVKTPDDLPLSSLAEVYSSIYQDLDEAIVLFNESGEYESRDDESIHHINIDVTKAIYARAALTREDWATAATMASEARAKYVFMSEKELLEGGFNEPNPEWIWGSYGGSEENLHYFSFHSYIAWDANSSIVKGYPALINKPFYKNIPDTDIRKQWWVAPPVDNTEAVGLIPNGNIKDSLLTTFRKLKENGASLYYYMQFKFSVLDQVGVGYLCHFRSSEMYLIEAEALARQEKYAEAQALMNEFNKNSGRDAEYNCVNTGEDLINEILFYRELELWGEGFEWFDLKRTNRPIDRKSRSEGGNFESYVAVTRKVDYANGWCWSIPLNETDYNPSINN